ncbi:hypothetical protein V7183_17000, partial [Bacillus sp. JJ1127]
NRFYAWPDTLSRLKEGVYIFLINVYICRNTYDKTNFFTLETEVAADLVSIQITGISSALLILFFSCILALWVMTPS